MSEEPNTEPENNAQPSGFVYPPKPEQIERRDNALRRSLVSLITYGLLFYFLFIQDVTYIATLLLVLIIHEMGHFLLMKLFNYNNVKIFIVPLLGAFTSGKKQHVSQWQLSFIILGGPVPGIVIGCILFWMNKDLHNETLKMLYETFLFINLLNCLPFYPLDGGRLIETLFFRNSFVARMVFGIISILALIGLFFSNSSPFLLVIPVFIALELYNEFRNNKIREYLKQENIEYHTDYALLPDRNYWLIRDCLLLAFPKKYAGITPGQYQYSAIEPAVMNHVSAVLQTNLRLDMSAVGKIIMFLFYLMLFIGPALVYVLLK